LLLFDCFFFSSSSFSFYFLTSIYFFILLFFFFFLAPTQCGIQDSCSWKVFGSDSQNYAVPTWQNIYITPLTDKQSGFANLIRAQSSNSACPNIRPYMLPSCLTDQAIIYASLTTRIQSVLTTNGFNPQSQQVAIATANVDSRLFGNGCNSGDAFCIVTVVPIKLKYLRDGDYYLVETATGSVGIDKLMKLAHPIDQITTQDIVTLTFTHPDTGASDSIVLTYDHLIYKRTSDSTPGPHTFTYSSSGPYDYYGDKGVFSFPNLVAASTIAVGDEIW
jgi:hypothetical protein